MLSLEKYSEEKIFACFLFSWIHAYTNEPEHWDAFLSFRSHHVRFQGFKKSSVPHWMAMKSLKGLCKKAMKERMGVEKAANCREKLISLCGVFRFIHMGEKSRAWWKTATVNSFFSHSISSPVFARGRNWEFLMCARFSPMCQCLKPSTTRVNNEVTLCSTKKISERTIRDTQKVFHNFLRPMCVCKRSSYSIFLTCRKLLPC